MPPSKKYRSEKQSPVKAETPEDDDVPLQAAPAEDDGPRTQTGPIDSDKQSIISEEDHAIQVVVLVNDYPLIALRQKCSQSQLC
jgi:hypothetical protein